MGASGSERYILALDQGTTSSRAILFNRAGTPISMAQRPFKQIYPRPGWVEHDPEDIWDTQIGSARDAVARAQVKPSQIEAIGIANQRETTLLWDRKTGKPACNAVVWQCRRSEGICVELKEKGTETAFRSKTGLVLDPYFSGTKLAWLFRNDPLLLERARRGELSFGTVDSWLIYRLSGAHLCDATNASRTLLFDIHERRWDPELLSILGIPEKILPEIRPSSADYGKTSADFLGAPIPIRGCAGDQQAALFGQGCFGEGDIKNTYGTGCFTLMNIGKAPLSSKNGLLTTIAWDLGADRRPDGSKDAGLAYALEGSVFMGGAVIQWLRDELGIIKEAAESEELARSVSDSGGVFLIPAFTGLGAPHWDASARGTIVGLTRGSGRAALCRAALESIAYQSSDLIASMEADSGLRVRSLKADGGASQNSFLMQFQADIMGRAVVVPETSETTALGAAYLAGLSTGYWSSLDDIRENWKERRRFEPGMSTERRAALIAGWNEALAAARSYKPAR
jgi:glycerol kinase